MGLFDSILGALTGKSDSSGRANSVIGILDGILAQSGGLQGLANKFSQGGLGGVFSSWVGMGENETISADQIQNVLGSQEVNALAEKIGVDPAQVSNFLAEYLPKVVDKLTPEEKWTLLRITRRAWPAGLDPSHARAREPAQPGPGPAMFP